MRKVSSERIIYVLYDFPLGSGKKRGKNMSFFRFNKEIKTADLKLSDYEQIWTKFCFLDETGSLNDVNDPFFTVGILKLSQPYYLASKIDYERRKRNFHDEMKFNKLSRNNLKFAKFVVETLFDTRSVNFCSYSVDKDMRVRLPLKTNEKGPSS